MCAINCSGGCPECSPEDHKQECVEENEKNREHLRKYPTDWTGTKPSPMACSCNVYDYTILFPSHQGSLEFNFSYEEMVELLSGGMEKVRGNEAFESMKDKAKRSFEALPVTDY